MSLWIRLCNHTYIHTYIQAKRVNHLEPASDNRTQLTRPSPVLSEVVTCNCVRNPGGHTGKTVRGRGQRVSRPPTTGSSRSSLQAAAAPAGARLTHTFPTGAG